MTEKMQRQLSELSGVSFDKIRKGTCTPQERKRVFAAWRKLKKDKK